MKTKSLGLLENYSSVIALIVVILSVTQVVAATRYSVATGNWNQTSTWSSSSGGPGGAGVPVAGDAVIIEGGFTVTATAAAACGTINFPGSTSTPSTLAINPGITLNVSGTISISRTSYGYNPNTIAVGAGNLNAGSLVFTNGGGINRHQITISTGTVTVSGNVTQSGSTGSATISFSGAGLLRLGGAFLNSATGTLILSPNCTVEYFASSAQTIGSFTYNNLTLSGSGTKTLSNVTINEILLLQGTATTSGTVPAYGSNATIKYNGSVSQETGNEFPLTFSGTGGIIINNTNDVTLDANRTISSLLAFTAGKIITNSYILSLGSGATISGAGAGKYINGNLLWNLPNTGSPSRTFEIGDATNYTPVIIDLHNMSGTPGALTGHTSAGDHSAIGYSGINPEKSVNRTWTFTASGLTFSDYDATLNFVTGDVDAGANTAAFIVKKYNIPDWSSPAFNGAANPSNTKAVGFGSFGEFQVGEGTTTQSLVYTSSGTFIPPAGITSVDVECWGGGGAGGGATGYPGAGGGGAGGAYVKSINITVTPGTPYTVSVGSAANGTTNTIVNGNPSWFGTAATIYAQGGNGGAPALLNNSNGAGGSGSSGSSTGNTKFAGGSGSNGKYPAGIPGGAGGGGAGSTGAGGNASSGTGGAGTPQNGGNGANGVGNAMDGTAGYNYGGGGSGGKATADKGNSCTDQKGGNGAQGLVRITYSYPVYSLTAITASTVCDINSGSIITLSSTAEGLPPGTYIVTYDLSAPNAATGLTASMTVNTAGTGTFTTPYLAVPGSTSITITYLATAICGNAIYVNNSAVINVFQTVTFGIVTYADETFINSGDPSVITFSEDPAGGAGTYTYQWYYRDSLVTCPLGSDISEWTIMSDAAGSSYDPPSGLTVSRTFAVLVDVTGAPDCGDASWATGCRKITMMYTPVANNDSSSGNIPGNNAVLNILTNDILGNGNPANPGSTTVDIDPSVTGEQTTLVVPAEGTWAHDLPSGILTFDPNPGFTTDPTPIVYLFTETATGLSDPATVTVDYILLPPVANNDDSTGNLLGTSVTLNILCNDSLCDGCSSCPVTVSVDIDQTKPDQQSTMNVTGEGTWVYNVVTGELTFDPDPAFKDNPTPIEYTLTELETSMSDNALVTIEYKKPDITPNITAEPNVMQGETDFDIIIKVTELIDAPTDGLITILVPKDSRWVLNGPYDKSATTIGNNLVDNADWDYSSDAIYHIFTSAVAIPATGVSQFGFHARWSAVNTAGSYTITSQITSWSGGENRIDNNVDAEKLDYFIY